MSFVIKIWKLTIAINLFDLDLSDRDIKFTITKKSTKVKLYFVTYQ